MSVILCLSPEHNPVVIADGLLSSTSGKRGVRLPTIGDLHDTIAPEDKYRVHGLTQKLVFVHDWILVAWAGHLSEAQTILRSLQIFFSTQTVSCAEVRRVLESHGAHRNTNLSLIVLVKESEKWSATGYGCDHVSIPRIGSVLVAGTGKQLALDHLATPFTQNGNGILPMLDQALLLCGRLLAEEIQSGKTLSKAFGAFYEIAYIEKTGIKKLEDVLFSFWFGTIDRKNGDLKLHKLLRQFSASGQTCFQSLEIQKIECGDYALKSDAFLITDLLNQKLVFEKPVLSDLNVSRQVHAVFIQQGKSATWVLTMQCEPELERRMIRFETKEDQISLFINRSLLERSFALGQFAQPKEASIEDIGTKAGSAENRGHSISLYIRAPQLSSGGKREYLFELTTQGKCRFSAYRSDKIFSISVIDVRGTKHTLNTNDQIVFPSTRFVHLCCEIATFEERNVLRIRVDGMEIASHEIAPSINVRPLAFARIVIGANANGKSCGRFDLAQFLRFTAIQSDLELANLRTFLVQKGSGKYVQYTGNSWMRSDENGTLQQPNGKQRPICRIEEHA